MSRQLVQALAHDHKGYSEEKCTRCGWVMGRPPLNCLNNDTPHVFPSQLPCTDPDCFTRPHHRGATGCVDEVVRQTGALAR